MEFETNCRADTAILKVNLSSRNRSPPKPCLGVDRLRDTANEHAFATDTESSFVNRVVADSWETFVTTSLKQPKNTRRMERMINKEWNSHDIWKIVKWKRLDRLRAQTEEYRRLQNECRSALRRRNRQSRKDDKTTEVGAVFENGQLEDAFARLPELHFVMHESRVH